MTTSLVTGAAGFIASHLIESLLSAGDSIVGIDNFDPFYPKELKLANLRTLAEKAQSLGLTFSFIEGSIVDPQLWEKLPANMTRVFHLAAKAGVRPSVEDPLSYWKCNTEGTVQLLDWCRKNKVNDVIFGSSSSVYGDDTQAPFPESAACENPLSPYGASKRAGEIICSTYARLYSMRIYALRFFTVYGPRQRPDLAIASFAKKIVNGETITLYGDPERSERDYTHATDIVRGILGAAKHLNAQPIGTYDVFNLGSSSPVKLKHLVDVLSESLALPAHLKYESARQGEVFRTFADVRKSQGAFDFFPKVRFEDGIKDYADWLLQSGQFKD